ncbi:MAG: hypothetical protein U0795_26840 [Pirellulales bacterium]
MKSPVYYDDLVPCQRRLMEIGRRNPFGRIRGLPYWDGLPVLDPLPRVEQDHKFGAMYSAPPPHGPGQRLRAQWIELFDFFAARQNGVVDVLEFKHGQPFWMSAEGNAA